MSAKVLKNTREFQDKTQRRMSHHINFDENPFKKNYIGTLKHQIFEKIMNRVGSQTNNGRNARLTQNSVKALAKEHVSHNLNLLKMRRNDITGFQELWPKVESDFNNFSVQCQKFAKEYIGKDRPIQFQTHMNTVGQIKILGVKYTEKFIKSMRLGVQGKVDIVFDCLYQPDIRRSPDVVLRRDVIADLKTGQYTKKNNHQIMYYMMAYFEDDLDEQVGFVIYSKSPRGERGFALDFVFPYKNYFLNLIVHKNHFSRVSSGTLPTRFQARYRPVDFRRSPLPDPMSNPHQISSRLRRISRNTRVSLNVDRSGRALQSPSREQGACSVALKIMSILFLAILIVRFELLKNLVPSFSELTELISK